MNAVGFLVWGLSATVVLTTLMSGAQRLGLSRMSIPYLLGTMFVKGRDFALAVGTAAHMVNGLVFAAFYALVFESLGFSTLWLGTLLSLLHAAALLLVVLPALPGLHPRMASESQGPEPTSGLEPPGPLAVHYGKPTAAITLAAHLIYGAMLGAFYVPA